MGFSRDEPGTERIDREDAPPFLAVVSSGFWIARHELTRAEAHACLQSGEFEFASSPVSTEEGSEVPLTGISWRDAYALCKHLTGLRLVECSQQLQQGRLTCSTGSGNGHNLARLN